MANRSRVSLQGGENVLKLIVKKCLIVCFTFVTVNHMSIKLLQIHTYISKEDTPTLPSQSQDTL